MDKLPQIEGLKKATKKWPHDERASAVCMLFCNQSREVVFTKRSTKVRSHKGQISFAGGRRETADQSPVETALRELEEELGVSSVEVLGELDSVFGLDAKSIVTIVARTEQQNFTPSDAEVAEVISVDWRLLKRDLSREFSFNLFGTKRKSILYKLGEKHLLWGITAQIVHSANLRD